MVGEQFQFTAEPHTWNYRWIWAVRHSAARNPRTSNSYGRNHQPRRRASFVEIWRRPAADPDSELFSRQLRRRVYLRPHQGRSIYVPAAARRAATDAVAGVRASGAALLSAALRHRAEPSEQQ